MKRTRTTLTVALTASLVVLTGCSTEGPAAPTTTGPATAQPVAQGTGSDTHSGIVAVDDRDQWAEAKMQAWFDAEGAADKTELYPPFNRIKSWESPVPGELVINVDPAITDTDHVYLDNLGPANDLWMIAAVMLDQTWTTNPDLSIVTARTTDGARAETYTRADRIGPQASGTLDPSSQEWADEKIEMWLQAEGVRTIQGLLHPFDQIQSWESTGPGALTVHFDPAMLEDPQHNGPGELGAPYWTARLMWQNLYCGASDLEAITITTTDGQQSQTLERERIAEMREASGDVCY
jgi:hypothetical protein